MSLELTEHQNHLNDNIMKLEETVLLHEKINRFLRNFIFVLNIRIKFKKCVFSTD